MAHKAIIWIFSCLLLIPSANGQTEYPNRKASDKEGDEISSVSFEELPQGVTASADTIALNGNTMISGTDNDGTNAALKIISGNQSLLLDGNEVDGNGGILLNNNVSSNVTMVTGGGNVGIGADGPASRLVVTHNPNFVGSSDWTATIDAETSDSMSAALNLRNNAGESILFARGDGRVGIGNTVPNASLDVMGEIAVNSQVVVDSQGRFVGDMSNIVAEPTGVAGGDLTGSYPNPQLDTDAVVHSLNGLQGDLDLQEGDRIQITTSLSGVQINVEEPPFRTWNFSISELSPLQLGSGGPGVSSDTGLSLPIPVYWFNKIDPGSTWASGMTTLPDLGEVDNDGMRVELFWTTTQDGGDVQWRLEYLARREFNTLGVDGAVEVSTPVSFSGSSRIYKTEFLLSDGINQGDQIFIFNLARQSFADTNSGHVGLLGIRFAFGANF